MAHNIEQLCKMTRMGSDMSLTLTSGPLPVKFRPVYYNPSLEEEESKSKRNNANSSYQDDDELDEELLQKADAPFDGNHFFKDPLCPSYTKEQDISKEDSSSSNKLGRNMRACASKKVTNAEKTVWGQMAARQQLLQQQKREQLIHSKKENSDKEAVALINNLIEQGFRITPPEETPRFDDYHHNNYYNYNPSACDGEGRNEENAMTAVRRGQIEFVKSIHNELKRVKGKKGEDEEEIEVEIELQEGQDGIPPIGENGEHEIKFQEENTEISQLIDNAFDFEEFPTQNSMNNDNENMIH